MPEKDALYPYGQGVDPLLYVDKFELDRLKELRSAVIEVRTNWYKGTFSPKQLGLAEDLAVIPPTIIEQVTMMDED